MTKDEILSALDDVLANIEHADSADQGEEHGYLIAAKESLASATQGVAEYGTASNGVGHIQPDPNAPSANAGSTADPLADTSGIVVTDSGEVTDQEGAADPSDTAPSA